MEDKRTTKPLTKAQIDGKSADRRTPRTIRFTDSEWSNVSQAAAAANISTATFARNAILNAIAEPAAASGSALPPGILELVKRTYRSAYILSTLKRDDMIREGRQEQLENTVRAARDAEAQVLGDASE